MNKGSILGFWTNNRIELTERDEKVRIFSKMKSTRLVKILLLLLISMFYLNCKPEEQTKLDNDTI